jgi:hypothetical protein
MGHVATLKRIAMHTRFLALPLLALAASAPALAANDPWAAPFTVQVGGFRADASTSVRLDTETRGGTELSFEGDLGLQRTKSLPDLQFVWRFNPRHALEAGYLELKRSGSRTISGNIDFGDASFPVNSQVNSSFDTSEVRVAYRYSPIHDNNGNELSLLLGLHYTQLKMSLATQAGTISDSASVDVPLPTLGVRGAFRLTEHLRLTGFAEALKVKIDQYDGEFLTATVGLEWAFMPQAYAGIGYNYFRYKLESTKGNARGRFDLDFDGPAVYAGWSF